MKKISSMLLGIVMMLALCLPVLAEGMLEANVVLNNQPVTFEEQNAVITEGRTLVPLRGVFEAMGAEVDWDESNAGIFITLNQTAIYMSIGSNNMSVIDLQALASIASGDSVYYPENITLDVPPQLMNDRTMIPLAAVSRSLGAQVDWDEATTTVSIIYLTEADETGENQPSASPTATPSATPTNEGGSTVTKPEKYPQVTIEMENGDKMVAELYPEIAPNTVYNFISLVKKGYYNGLTFHRVIPNFMIQGGDPQGTGAGGPGYTIKGEFANNGFANDLKHTEGVLSMARTMMPDSAGSQFFVMVADSPHLDNNYAAFGKLIEGLDVAKKIVSVDRDVNDKPLEAQVMKTVTVETFGEEYPEPEIIK